MKKKSARLYLSRKCPTDCCEMFFITLLIFFVLSVAFTITVRTCDAEEFAGKLVFSEGSVLFSLDKGGSWSPVTPLMEFPQGAYIKVGSDGEAALMLNDRSQIRLSAGSLLFF